MRKLSLPVRSKWPRWKMLAVLFLAWGVYWYVSCQFNDFCRLVYLEKKSAFPEKIIQARLEQRFKDGASIDAVMDELKSSGVTCLGKAKYEIQQSGAGYICGHDSFAWPTLTETSWTIVFDQKDPQDAWQVAVYLKSKSI